MSFSLRNCLSSRWFGIASAIVFVAGLASPTYGAAKDRVYNEIKNDSPAGNNASGIYAELKGNAHQFIGWGGTAWMPPPANQRLVPNANGALLFSNTAAAPDPLPSAAAPTAKFSQRFKGNQTVAPNNYLLFDSVRDAGGAICLKVENGCLRPTELTNAMGMALPSTKIDPFNRFIRRPAGRSAGLLEVEIVNGSDRPASLDFLEVLVNNTGSVFDLSVPFVPNGIAATLIGPSFVPGQTLAPDESITFTFSGSFDDTLAISAETGGMVDGVYLRGLTGTVIPEPATSAMLLLGLAGAAVRRVRG